MAFLSRVSTFLGEGAIIKAPLLKVAVVGVMWVALACAGPAAARPNVLLIVTDDQRWDTLGYMPTVQEELVQKGVTFENAFAVNPVCCPSRASILTGLYSHTTGVWAIGGPHGGFHRFQDASTLPVWLDQAGYTTMLGGKYLNGYFDAYVPPGWDRWFAYTSRPNAYFGYEATDGDAVLSFGSEPGDYATDVLAERAVHFIRNSGLDPFFLYFAPKAPHNTAPHTPATPAPRHTGSLAGLEPWQPPNLNEADVSDKPLYVRRRAPVAEDYLDRLRQDQLESLLAVDEGVHSMLAALEETGKLADTLVVFTSDNGFGWGEHRRAHKIVPYEESIRIPLVVRYDRLGLSPRSEPRFALNLDLAPTIAAVANVPAVGVEGRSLLSVLTGRQIGWRPSFLIESYMQKKWHVPAYCGFRGQRWKYVQYATGEEELYDLARDPYELRSLHRVRLERIIAYRGRIRRSACRPPGFQPRTLCTQTGTPWGDWLRGTLRRDWICAGAGRDRIDVRAGGRDLVRCGPGFDRVRAGALDRLRGCELRL